MAGKQLGRMFFALKSALWALKSGIKQETGRNQPAAGTVRTRTIR
jgi:hypothetical protein